MKTLLYALHTNKKGRRVNEKKNIFLALDFPLQNSKFHRIKRQ